MAQLSVKEVLKPFNKGEMIGKERYHMLIKKIENKEPFVFSTGELNPIKFENEQDFSTLKSNDIERINAFKIYFIISEYLGPAMF